MSHREEIESGRRFAFGRNWRRYLEVLDEARIRSAENSLQQMLQAESLEGRRFLDIGAGSGLFSLAARRLGAVVHSFDFDPDCVACTGELRRLHFPEDRAWTVEEGSILDSDFLRQLGTFDIVYSWGVLHHTGAMWKACENAASLVSARGALFVALYNDQGMRSKYWLLVKRTFNASSSGRVAMVALHAPVFLFGRFLARMVSRRPQERGMSLRHDMLDWLGGYPFEVASPDKVIDYFGKRRFGLAKLATAGGGLGCNEYVFVRQE